MITLRAAIIIVLCFIVVVGTRCSCCKCDDVKTIYKYRFDGVKLSHLDYSGKDTMSLVNNAVKKEAYAMRVDLELGAFGGLAKKVSFPALFINEAYAFQPGCRCENVAMEPAHKVKRVTIVDLKKFDGLEAGADITDRFAYYVGFKSVVGEKKYIGVGEYFYASFPYVSTGSVSPAFDQKYQTSFVLFLMKPPVESGAHQFKFSITLDDGADIEYISEAITLN